MKGLIGVQRNLKGALTRELWLKILWETDASHESAMGLGDLNS